MTVACVTSVSLALADYNKRTLLTNGFDYEQSLMFNPNLAALS
jgi:hypothetical protein